MCGIAGIFNCNGAPIDKQLLIRMTRTLTHRGPDEEGYFVNTLKGVTDIEPQIPFHTFNGMSGKAVDTVPQGHVGLGHRRLSIIDLSTGQQPLCNEDGSIWIVFNGEIYNFQAVQSELDKKGHRFRTNSDTETIVHAYEEWGEQALGRLRGMFSFALWDERQQQLLLARDRLGKKPLYYLQEQERILFGSEIKAILEAPGVSRDLDVHALSDYLSLLYVPAPRSIFSSIRKLPAGHYAIASRDSFEVRSYWDLNFAPCHELSEAQMMDDLLGILEESTRLRMISDVPLGAFLSGGVDSSAVVAMMAQASKEPVITNSISFSVSSYDETEYARKIARQFTTNHHEFRVEPEAMSVIEKLAWHYDEPFADSSAIPTYYVSQIARNNVTVSLSGDGGDENFAGYHRYYYDLRENVVRNLLPAAFQKPIFEGMTKLYPQSEALSSIFRGKAFLKNVARDPVDAYFFSMSAFHDDEKQHLLKPEVFKALGGYRTSELFHQISNSAPAEDHLSRIQYLDIKTYLCGDILAKVDRASMAVSLEVRCPILDHVFMEYVARIPSKLKRVGTDGKHIIKKALKRYLPDDILYRRKMGFGVPVLEWLKSDLREYAGNLILEGSASQTYLQRDYLEKIWDQHQRGSRDLSMELWNIMMFNLWHDRFVKTP